MLPPSQPSSRVQGASRDGVLRHDRSCIDIDQAQPCLSSLLLPQGLRFLLMICKKRWPHLRSLIRATGPSEKLGQFHTSIE